MPADFMTGMVNPCTAVLMECIDPNAGQEEGKLRGKYSCTKPVIIYSIHCICSVSLKHFFNLNGEVKTFLL